MGMGDRPVMHCATCDVEWQDTETLNCWTCAKPGQLIGTFVGSRWASTFYINLNQSYEYDHADHTDTKVTL